MADVTVEADSRYSWVYPVGVVLAAAVCGVVYARITGKIVSLDDIRDRVNALCVTTPGTRGTFQPQILCSPHLSGGEIKARALWAISLGVTAITGTACLLYCGIAAFKHGQKRSLVSDNSFHAWFFALGVLSLLLVFVFAAIAFAGHPQSFWIDPIQPAFSPLFDEVLSPSRQISVEAMVMTKVMPIESMVIAAALAIYVAVCAACVAPVSPHDPDQAQEEPNELMYLLAGRMRLLNRVIAIASAALSLAIASVGAYSAWPAALVRGSGDVTQVPQLARFADELDAIGTASTLHWAACIITIGLPAYVFAVSRLIALAKRQARVAVKAASEKASEEEKKGLDLDRDAAETDWIKKHGIDMDWAAVLKRAVALFSPLATGALVALTTALVGG